MKIIDFKRKGNAVRFFLGSDDLAYWYGENWDVNPMEVHAKQVDDQFIVAEKDFFYSVDYLMYDPGDCHETSDMTKEDLVLRKVPCLIIVPKEVADKYPRNRDQDNYFFWLSKINEENLIVFYFGDTVPTESVLVSRL
jgi:hypothetical protein